MKKIKKKLIIFLKKMLITYLSKLNLSRSILWFVMILLFEKIHKQKTYDLKVEKTLRFLYSHL